ncbi:MAG: RHS repeat-associated core domain-containing protein, partial [Pseudanabaena sp.]
SQNGAGGKSFYLYDGLGSVRALTNSSGVVTDRYNYDAYGTLLNSSGRTSNNYKFTGEQFDPNLGDYYLRDRYYSTGIGRFTRADSYEGNTSDPISLNDYLYANGNPVIFTDPTGKFSIAEFSAAESIRNTLASIQVDIGSNLVRSLTDQGLDPSEGAMSAALDFINNARTAYTLVSLAPTVLGVVNYNLFVPFRNGLNALQLAARWGIPNGRRLGNNLIAAGRNPQPGIIFHNSSNRALYEAHHIVPGTLNDPIVNRLRSQLSNAGIRANDAANGVWLRSTTSPSTVGVVHGNPQMVTPNAHSRAYIDELADRLRGKRSKNAIERILRQVAQELEAGTFPH